MPVPQQRSGQPRFGGLAAATVSAFLILGALSEAAACLPLVDRFPNTDADYQRFARAMVREAHFVDVVEVLGGTAIVDPLRWDAWLQARELRRDGAVDWARRRHAASRSAPLGIRFDLKVVERLKAAGPVAIQIEGAELRPAVEAYEARDLEHVRDPHEHRFPFVFLEPQELAGGIVVEEISCHPPALALESGAKYLVLRDQRGRLLGPVHFTRGEPPSPGYRLVLIQPGGPLRWLEAVRKAALAEQRREGH